MFYYNLMFSLASLFINNNNNISSILNIITIVHMVIIIYKKVLSRKMINKITIKTCCYLRASKSLTKIFKLKLKRKKPNYDLLMQKSQLDLNELAFEMRNLMNFSVRNSKENSNGPYKRYIRKRSLSVFIQIFIKANLVSILIGCCKTSI